MSTPLDAVHAVQAKVQSLAADLVALETVLAAPVVPGDAFSVTAPASGATAAGRAVFTSQLDASFRVLEVTP